MGNYVFTTKVLVDAIRADSENSDSDHDMGGDIIPAFDALDDDKFFEHSRLVSPEEGIEALKQVLSDVAAKGLH